MTLLNAMKNTTTTQNGAVTNVSTNSSLLDFYYHAAAKRGRNGEVVELFEKAFKENPTLAIVALFQLRDCRGGKGERSSAQACFKWLVDHKVKHFEKIVHLIPEYGRFDDLLEIAHRTNIWPRMLTYIGKLLRKDMVAETPTLLAKWLPSENASSAQSRSFARAIAYAAELTPRQYRKALSTLREKINVVEREMSAGKWNKINYSAVPSRASMIYRKAFAKHDSVRYGKFIEKAVKGEVKINAAQLYPYDLVTKYVNNYNWGINRSTAIDQTLEAQWNQLPNYMQDTDDRWIVVADCSGSMYGGGSTVRPIDVSVSLAIYAAQRLSGPFKNHFISYADNPQLVALKGTTLLDAVKSVQEHVGYSTNLQAVFSSLLTAAKRNKVAEDEMPTHVCIVSDMEFNSVEGERTNFEAIQDQYTKAGYTMPKLIFWNVNSTGKQTPVTQNEQGVYLVSGCSPTVFASAINAKAITPYDFMVEDLTKERYVAVLDALQ